MLREVVNKLPDEVYEYLDKIEYIDADAVTMVLCKPDDYHEYVKYEIDYFKEGDYSFVVNREDNNRVYKEDLEFINKIINSLGE